MRRGLAVISGDSRFLVADTTSGVACTLQSDGGAIAAENIGQTNCGGSQVDSTLHSLLFSLSSTWVSAAEPSRAIPGLPYDAVALSFDGTSVAGLAQTINGVLSASPAGIAPGIDPPAPRSAYAVAYSRAAGGIFVAGGKSVSDHSTLHDVWFQPIGGAWGDVTPHGGAAALGTIDAITYSYDDKKIWIVDEIPFVGKKANLTAVRLLRASPSGGIEELATWQKLGLTESYFLSIDHDGSPVLSFGKSKGNGFGAARIHIERPSGQADASALYCAQASKLLGPAFVSPVGYGFFVQAHSRAPAVTRLLRLPALQKPKGIDELLCP